MRCPVIRLSDQDNVAVAIADIAPGTEIALGALRLAARDAVPLGHKIALRHIAAGEKIRKFGVPIGSASAAIEAGSHVHLHNLRSDYLTNDEDHYE